MQVVFWPPCLWHLLLMRSAFCTKNCPMRLMVKLIVDFSKKNDQRADTLTGYVSILYIIHVRKTEE